VSGLPSGTVTLLFTDIEGSTRLLDELGDHYQELLEGHHRILRQAIADHSGVEVDTEGDAFFCAFSRAEDALAAAAQAQRGLAEESWPQGKQVRVRMGIHTGSPAVAGENYIGIDVHRAARITAAGHGGQVLVSEATRALLDSNVALRDLGEHRLKDLSQAQRLYQFLIADLETDFPALKTLENRPTNLPTQPTPLIGRKRELEAVGDLLAREDVRLLTLVGPGGTGKTRLALQLAAEQIERYPSGVFLVALAALTDSALVLPTIAQTLGLKEEGDRPLSETIADYLQEKELLLLLDNFEQVSAAAAELPGLLSTTKVKLVVTSRAPLQVSGEQQYPVPPLALPRRGDQLAELTQYESVRLFLERARAVRPDFELTDSNAAAIAELCERLDGLPLAIELAAARVKLLTPDAMLTRLESRLKLLTGGARDLPERQQTLRGAIDWSYELLDERERTMFNRLSVFVGGRSLEAIEAVCDPDGELGIDALECVASLIDKSLLRQEEADGQPRFVMLETIHEYARERLESSGEADDLRRRHAGFFLELAERLTPALLNPSRGEIDFVGREYANLRRALAWYEQTGNGPQLLRFVGALRSYWTLTGQIAEARNWIEVALSLTEGERSEDRAQAFRGASFFARVRGDYQTAFAEAERAVEMSRGFANRSLLASSLEALAMSLARSIGDFHRAEALYLEAIALAEQAGDDILTQSVRANLGDLELNRSNYARAAEIFESLLAEWTEGTQDWDRAYALGNIGVARIHLGEYERAENPLREGLEISRRLDFKEGVAYFLTALGTSAVLQGSPTEGLELLAAGEALRAQHGLALEPFELAMQDRAVDNVRSALDNAAFGRAWLRGTEANVDEVVAKALAPDKEQDPTQVDFR
jgi:predicted ATPase/class 3 adenylate cyclase